MKKTDFIATAVLQAVVVGVPLAASDSVAKAMRQAACLRAKQLADDLEEVLPGIFDEAPS